MMITEYVDIVKEKEKPHKKRNSHDIDIFMECPPIDHANHTTLHLLYYSIK